MLSNISHSMINNKSFDSSFKDSQIANSSGIKSNHVPGRILRDKGDTALLNSSSQTRLHSGVSS